MVDELNLPGRKILPHPVRQYLRRQVLTVLSHDGTAPDYDTPLGDPGLFGPDSVVWKIHADFPSMMAGGLAALMMQSLHPLALAGVWDHSTFRSDALGRLRRTTAFVSRTTFAPRAPAEAAMARVRRIHQSVHGTAPDGRPYSAEDPALLTWVHCAEAWCFLHAYQAFCVAGIPVALQDRYLDEFALVAEGLGARGVPRTVADLEDYFNGIRGELEFGERTREVLYLLSTLDLPIPLAGLGRSVFLRAAATVLPPWALSLLQRSALQRAADRAAAASLRMAAPSIRDVLARGGLAWRSCVRTGASYEDLFRWPHG